MNHPEKILKTLDKYLSQPIRLIIYGRAALALGYQNSPKEFLTTYDVDAILPEVEMNIIEKDNHFWDAIEKTNEELADSGLYITHLFSDTQIIIRENWLSHIHPIEKLDLKFVKLFRPSTDDLLLTKMMRVDAQDREDILFLLSQTKYEKNHVQTLLNDACVPSIMEIQEAFRENAKWVLENFSKSNA